MPSTLTRAKRVSVADSITEIVEANRDRKYLEIRNRGGNIVFVGGSGVAVTDGWLITTGQQVDYSFIRIPSPACEAAIFGIINNPGASNLVDVLEFIED